MILRLIIIMIRKSTVESFKICWTYFRGLWFVFAHLWRYFFADALVFSFSQKITLSYCVFVDDVNLRVRVTNNNTNTEPLENEMIYR